jgi:hypothetical protein
MNNIDITTINSSFIGFLTMLFILLKLSKVITWSWFWVLSPSLVGVVLLIIMIIIWWRK